VRLRNKWVEVDPRDWKARNDLTINVGLGTGGKSEQLAHLMTVIGLQKEAMAAGLTNLVGPQQIYNTAKELTKLVGLKNVDAYFLDPSEQPPPPEKPDPEVAKMQMQAEIEKTQAQADIATQQKKVEADIALAQQKFALERELKLLDARLKAEEHQRAAMAEAVKAAAGAPALEPPGPDGMPAAAPAGGSNAALVAALMDTLARIGAPRRAVKQPDGSWVTETVQ
jgi:hypothetical protein